MREEARTSRYETTAKKNASLFEQERRIKRNNQKRASPRESASSSLLDMEKARKSNRDSLYGQTSPEKDTQRPLPIDSP